MIDKISLDELRASNDLIGTIEILMREREKLLKMKDASEKVSKFATVGFPEKPSLDTKKVYIVYSEDMERLDEALDALREGER